MNFLKTAFYLLAIASLVACGGSGGGGSSSGGSGGSGTTNNAPAFSTGGTASVAEGATAVATLEASDDEGDTLTFAFGGGADDTLFTLDESTGALAFAVAPDFEAPGSAAGTNVYTIIVTVSDGTNDPVSLTIEITVTDVGSPAFTTTAAQSLVEGSTSVATIAAAGAVTMTGGADLTKFTLSNMNALTFNAAPDFENPLDADSSNTYEVIFTATEGTETSTLTMTVTVKDAYEGKIIDGPVSGATVFLDLDGDGVQDSAEPSTVSLSDCSSITADGCGAYFVEVVAAAEGVTPSIIAVGGIDEHKRQSNPQADPSTYTVNHSLATPLPSTGTEVFVTPISTLFVGATEAQRTKVLEKLGIGDDISITEILTTDIFKEAATGSATAQAVQKTNESVAAFFKSSVEMVGTDAQTAQTNTIAIVSQVSSAIVAKAAEVNATSGADAVEDGLLLDIRVMGDVITTAVTAYAAVTENVDAAVFTAETGSGESLISKLLDLVSRLVATIEAAVDITSTSAGVAAVSDAASISSFSQTADNTVKLLQDDPTDATALAQVDAGYDNLDTIFDSVEVSTQAAVLAAEAEANLSVDSGYTLPKNITVIETVE